MLPSLMNNSRISHAARLLSCGLVMAGLALSGCGLFDPTERDAAIVVGSTKVTLTQLKKDIEYFSSDLGLPLSSDEPVLDRLVERIVDHYLVLEYAKDKGFALTDQELEAAIKEIKGDYPDDAFQEALLRGYVDFDQWKRRLGEMILVDKVMKSVSESAPPPSNQEIVDYFEAHRDEFASPPMVKFRQIVVNSKEEGEQLLKRLRNGEKMTELAKAYSVAPEAENGGEVGWTAQGELDESMDKALFSLQKGKCSPVVKSPYGYHIFQVVATDPGGPQDLPAVVPQIEAKLSRESQEAYCRNWLSAIRKEYDVKINADLIKTLELS